MSFYEELKRRNVAKVAVLYIIAAWLLLQVTDVLSSLLTVPEWTGSLVVLLLLLGFFPVMIFSWVYELTPEGLKREKDIDRSQSISPETGRKINVLIIVLLVLAIGGLVVDRLVPETTTVTATSAIEQPDEAGMVDAIQPATGKPVPTPGHSIAVLPFVNMSNDPEQEYFSDGISEELLNVLAQYPDLRVAARTSSFQFKGKNPDIEYIAEKLHVNHVLEGSVRKSGNTLRITAQLIEADTGFHLWSETYDRELIDVFAIQDEISAAIGGALKIQLSLDGGSGKTSPTVLVASNTAAFDAYMRGRQLINLRGKRNLEEAVNHLEKALMLDETYAPAHAQLAIAISLLANTPGAYGDFTLEEIRRLATPHIERAFELDKRLPEAFGARTMFGLATLDYDSVIVSGNRALELNPSYADVLNWLYIAYEGTGRYADGVETLDRLLEVDPLSIVGRINRVARLALQGNKNAARAMADSISEQSHKISYLSHGRMSYSAGQLAEAMEWLLQAFVLDPDDSIIGIFIARILGQLDLLPEAFRLNRDFHYWVYFNRAMWPEALTEGRQRLANDPSDQNSQLYVANALHLSGEVEQAQLLYENLIAVSTSRLVIDMNSETVAPSARLALGRMRSGDQAGAMTLVELATENQGQRVQAGFINGEFYRATAILDAIVGKDAAAIQNLEEAIDVGLRDRSVFSEPAFDALRESPEFQALESRLDSIIAAEREKTLQMMCFHNPVPDAWQPLPETCEGVTTADRN
jgi:TolB-like protein